MTVITLVYDDTAIRFFRALVLPNICLFPAVNILIYWGIFVIGKTKITLNPLNRAIKTVVLP